MTITSRCPSMDWLPLPSDFQGSLRAALDTAKPAERLERLASLAAGRLGFLDTIQLDRALSQSDLTDAAGFSSLRLAVLSSSTVDHLAPGIRVAGLRRRLLVSVLKGAYGQYRQDILDPSSSLRQFAPQTILLSLSGREVIGGVALTASLEDVDRIITKFIGELRTLWRTARESYKATVIQQTFLDVTETLFGSYDRLVPGAPTRVIARLNDRLCDAAMQEGVLILDIVRAAARDGIDAWFDAGCWFQGKLEIAPQAAPAYGDLVARILAAQHGLSKKCLVVDLDNTLWGGVIGDDGLEGIVLGEGSAAGEAHLALQRYAKQLKDRGIILAVCSKNDAETAEAAFREHPEMLLERSDIAAFLANWQDKAENLKAIASRLNIGVDSLVFVDDNPVERSRIRQSLPAVAVPELPDDPAHYVRRLSDAGYFEAAAFTSEDRGRAELYAANAEREALLESAQTIDDFLRELEMTVVSGPFTAVDHARIVQLFNKTNQFNATTRRYTSEELAGLAALSGVLTLQFRLLDRIGDNGLVSAMILRPASAEENALEIDNWVMSCRVFGRQLEFEAMNIAVETARHLGTRQLIADYIATPKNGVISELYPRLGFTARGESEIANGTKRWLLNLADYAGHRTHIARAGAGP